MLDSFTLQVSAILLSTVMAATMLAMYMANGNEKCLALWSIAGFVNIIAYTFAIKLFDSPQNDSFVWLQKGLANSFFWAAHVAILLGLRIHLKLKLHIKYWILAALILCASHKIPYFYDNRIFLFFIFILAVKSISIKTLIDEIISTRQSSYFPLLLIEIFFLIQIFIRLLWTTFGESWKYELNNWIYTLGWLSDLLYLSGAILSCALIIVRKQVIDIRRLSFTDQLTGAYNRHALQEYAPTVFNKESKREKSTAILICDIDLFKKINDNYGHDTGDQVIQEVSRIIRMNIRPDDNLYRIGGEEFVALIKQSNPSETAVLAERLRKLVSESIIKTPECDISVTISIGIAVYDPVDKNWEATLKRADIALYQAKHNGRNCWIEATA